ncbi:cardiolipin synthase [Enterovibrio paralichthyis]|uniref:cardiolipin synthase n=1 Tax=Enterovibrio paralichthyis TaxID=2853805 RepID=UPI001C446F0C|nr:cardiolipin synthase [Enterovibrio paralichthyis]MBV7300151.1 cardiolipin synthase [Enterovibrio paralichthyis]
MEKIYQFIVWASIFFYWLLIAGVTIRVVLKRRALGVSIAWLMIIYIIPIVGVILYLLFGELNLGRKRAERAKAMFAPYGEWMETVNECEAHRPQHQSFLARPVHDLCLRRAGIPALAGNQLTLFKETADILRNIANDVRNAEHSVNMVFYIWHPGGHADDVAQAVCEAARRGVTVRLLLDSAGSKTFFRSHWPDAMRKAGVELIEALAVSPARMFLRRLDIRQHRKVVVIDNKIGYTGSMNLVDPRFFKQNAGVGQWVDIMVRTEGPAVPVLNSIFSWDWEVETGLRYLPELPQCTLVSEHHHANHSVQIAPSGPGMPDGIIQQVLMLAIHQAKKCLTITTPYLVPSESLLSALQTTAQRGVTVNIIVPAKNDSLMVEWASRSFFNDMLRAGINIYRFNGGLLHTKSVMVDSKFCLIGTVNLDMRSLWLNFELTLCVDDPEFCAEITALHESYILDSTLINQDDWAKRSLLNRPVEQFFYMFSPLL